MIVVNESGSDPIEEPAEISYRGRTVEVSRGTTVVGLMALYPHDEDDVVFAAVMNNRVVSLASQIIRSGTVEPVRYGSRHGPNQFQRPGCYWFKATRAAPSAWVRPSPRDTTSRCRGWRWTTGSSTACVGGWRSWPRRGDRLFFAGCRWRKRGACSPIRVFPSSGSCWTPGPRHGQGGGRARHRDTRGVSELVYSPGGRGSRARRGDRQDLGWSATRTTLPKFFRSCR